MYFPRLKKRAVLALQHDPPGVDLLLRVHDPEAHVVHALTQRALLRCAPFHVKPRVRFLKLFTRFGCLLIRRPTDIWKTSTVTLLETLRRNESRRPLPRRAHAHRAEPVRIRARRGRGGVVLAASGAPAARRRSGRRRRLPAVHVHVAPLEHVAGRVTAGQLPRRRLTASRLARRVHVPDELAVGGHLQRRAARLGDRLRARSPRRRRPGRLLVCVADRLLDLQGAAGRRRALDDASRSASRPVLLGPNPIVAGRAGVGLAQAAQLLRRSGRRWRPRRTGRRTPGRSPRRPGGTRPCRSPACTRTPPRAS